MQPRRAFFQAWRKLAKPQEFAKVVGPDGFGVDTGCRSQRVREGLVGGGQPDHAPLADGELHQGQHGEREYEDCGHGLFLRASVCQHHPQFPIEPPYHMSGTRRAARSAISLPAPGALPLVTPIATSAPELLGIVLTAGWAHFTVEDNGRCTGCPCRWTSNKTSLARLSKPTAIKRWRITCAKLRRGIGGSGEIRFLSCCSLPVHSFPSLCPLFRREGSLFSRSRLGKPFLVWWSWSFCSMSTPSTSKCSSNGSGASSRKSSITP